ncbi:MAG: c-type cytochrome [Gemmatimonadota bacterium]
MVMRTTWSGSIARILGRGVAAVVLAIGSVAPGSTQEPGGYENLQVLPADISRQELMDIMLRNQQDLGLPRRANEGCLFCHVGSMDVPSREWDWASDANPMKVKARAMMAMVDEINGRWLSDLDRSTELEVGCVTCHTGRTNPQPLPQLLHARYEEGGVDDLIETYQALRGRYFAAGAYDFRTHVLAGMAQELSGRGETRDAIRVHQLNIEASGDPAARHGLIQLHMVTALEARGIEAMVERYHELKDDHPTEAFTPPLLTQLGWTIFRDGREDAGYRVFELNYEEHPDAYAPTEDLAWGSAAIGDQARALALAEAWVARHPDHELGQRLLSDLRGGEE